MEDGAAMILDYLKKQNRPYSAIEVSANLHNKVTKAYASKVLKEMHERKEIEGRAAGKQLVYHVLQDPADDLMPDALHAIDEEIQQLQNDLTACRAREKGLRAELSALSAKVPIAELRQEVSMLEKEKESCLMRFSKIQTEAVKPVGVEEKTHVEMSWNKWQRHYNIRRKICRDLWSRCTEVLPDDTTEEDLWESLGLERDCEKL